ncbi:MAG: hypothetical protein J6M24_05185 [Lachnospiraceae bacterium]|nr:hypothetical protein [Lachnospiraceae bacterium]
MKKNNNKHSSARRKLAAATAMLLISALVLSSATYAWFTMNKQVSVVNMQVKAHAEEGLLINEVKTATDTHWDEVATGGQNVAIALRPASTADFTSWWHANSKKSNLEAGASGTAVDQVNTVEYQSGSYYKNISSGTTGILTSGTAASAGVNAERTIFFEDAHFGAFDENLQEGEGYYVMYTYYIKSSSSEDLEISAKNFLAKVNVDGVDASSGSGKLDASLRVGIAIAEDTTTYKQIFAPVSGATTSYYVANGANSINGTQVVAATAETGFNTDILTIPNVNSDGKPVYVYIWFEGEDPECKSDNLTATLDNLTIDITFTDNDL